MAAIVEGREAARIAARNVALVTAVIDVVGESILAYGDVTESDHDAAAGHALRAFGAYVTGFAAVLALTGVGALPAAIVGAVGALFMIAGQVVVWLTDDTPLQLIFAHSAFGVDHDSGDSASLPGWPEAGRR